MPCKKLRRSISTLAVKGLQSFLRDGGITELSGEKEAEWRKFRALSMETLRYGRRTALAADRLLKKEQIDTFFRDGDNSVELLSPGPTGVYRVTE